MNLKYEKKTKKCITNSVHNRTDSFIKCDYEYTTKWVTKTRYKTKGKKKIVTNIKEEYRTIDDIAKHEDKPEIYRWFAKQIDKYAITKPKSIIIKNNSIIKTKKLMGRK